MKHLRPKTVRQLSRKVRSRARAPLAKEDTSGLKRLNEIREIMKIVCFCETRKSAVNETGVTTAWGAFHSKFVQSLSETVVCGKHTRSLLEAPLPRLRFPSSGAKACCAILLSLC